MSERLMEKVVRIISGSANMVVKKVENKIPEVIMSEAVREIDGVIDEVNAELGQIEVAIYQTNKRHAREHTRLDEISEKIKVALAQNREDLIPRPCAIDRLLAGRYRHQHGHLEWPVRQLGQTGRRTAQSAQDRMIRQLLRCSRCRVRPAPGPGSDGRFACDCAHPCQPLPWPSTFFY